MQTEALPPDNGGFMVAAYLITAVIVVVYSAMLFIRAFRALRRER